MPRRNWIADQDTIYVNYFAFIWHNVYFLQRTVNGPKILLACETVISVSSVFFLYIDYAKYVVDFLGLATFIVLISLGETFGGLYHVQLHFAVIVNELIT